MIKEMLINFPQTRDELLRITHFTEAIYLNYNGEGFLGILRHYSKQLDDLRLIEALDNPKQKEKVTSINVHDANLLFDAENGYNNEDDNDDWLTSKPSGLKRNAQSSSSCRKPTKKARNDYNNDNDDEENTSNYFQNSQTSGSYSSQKKYKNSNKKKFWKFKKPNKFIKKKY